MTIRIRNTSGNEGSWVGQLIADQEYYNVSLTDRSEWADDPDVFADVASGNLTLNNGVDDLLNPIEGWKHLEGSLSLPISDIDNTKLSVHTSYKPTVPGLTTYAVWTGAGDDLSGGEVGGGEILHFNMLPGSPATSKEIRFLQSSGRVWIHEGYLKFVGAGHGDNMHAEIIAPPTQLQTSINLDLELDGDEVKFASGGPGTGTHGFGGTPILIPRTFSGDGAWDYDGTNLVPNVAETGGYKICTTESIIHRYINKIPCYGDCTYFSMSSDETTELNFPYFLRITANNVSDSNWHASIIMEIYRERTV